MFRRSATILMFALLAGTVGAQEDSSARLPSLEELTGEWAYQARALKDSPDDRTPVGGVIEFRADGTILTKTTTRAVEGTYTLDGDTATYTGPGGEETWTVRSFEPDKSLVVESGPMLSFLER